MSELRWMKRERVSVHCFCSRSSVHSVKPSSSHKSRIVSSSELSIEVSAFPFSMNTRTHSACPLRALRCAKFSLVRIHEKKHSQVPGVFLLNSATELTSAPMMLLVLGRGKKMMSMLLVHVMAVIPFSNKNSIISTWPCWAARWSGVPPVANAEVSSGAHSVFMSMP